MSDTECNETDHPRRKQKDDLAYGDNRSAVVEEALRDHLGIDDTDEKRRRPSAR